MRRWPRFLPLLITALWLPLQAVAGLAMPFCRHAADHAVQVEAAAPEEHCHGHGGNDVPAAAGFAGDQDCDGCELCHLASAGYMLPAMMTAAPLPSARDFEARPVLDSPSHIPEPPQYPPRRLS